MTRKRTTRHTYMRVRVPVYDKEPRCLNCGTPLAEDGWAVGALGQVECCKRPRRK